MTYISLQCITLCSLRECNGHDHIDFKVNCLELSLPVSHSVAVRRHVHDMYCTCGSCHAKRDLKSRYPRPQTFGWRQEKRCPMSWVIVIPKEGRAALLLVWRLFRPRFFFLKIFIYLFIYLFFFFWKVGVIPKEGPLGTFFNDAPNLILWYADYASMAAGMLW